MSKPSILLIPGATGLPDHYDAFFKVIAARGYEIRGLHLPSVCLKTETREGPPPTMYDDAAFIAKNVESLADEGKDVLIIMHSYGGVPGTESVKGLSKSERQKQGKKGGVVRFAYMTCLVPAVGVSAADVQSQAKLLEHNIFEIDEKGWISLRDIEKSAELSFSHMPREESLAWARKMQKHSAASFASPLTYAGYKDVPVSYLLCEEDRSIPASVQKAGIEIIERESGRPVDVTSVKTGHCPHVSARNETEEWIFKVLEG